LQPIQVQYGEAAEAPDRDGEGGVDYAVHGRGKHGDCKAMRPDLPGEVDILGVDGQRAGHESHVVETVSGPQSRTPPTLTFDARHAGRPLFRRHLPLPRQDSIAKEHTHESRSGAAAPVRDAHPAEVTKIAQANRYSSATSGREVAELSSVRHGVRP